MADTLHADGGAGAYMRALKKETDGQGQAILDLEGEMQQREINSARLLNDERAQASEHSATFSIITRWFLKQTV